MRFAIMTFLCFISAIVNAQNNSDLIGTWKLVSFWDNEVYFNLETDSTFLTHEMALTYPDSTDQKKFITQAKAIYGIFKFRFEDDSTLSLYMDTSFLTKVHYKVDKANGMFEMSSPNSLGQNIIDKFSYTIKNSILMISMTIEDKLCRFELRR